MTEYKNLEAEALPDDLAHVAKVLRNVLIEVWSQSIADAFEADAGYLNALQMAGDAVTVIPESKPHTMFPKLLAAAKKYSTVDMSPDAPAAWLSTYAFSPEQVKYLFSRIRGATPPLSNHEVLHIESPTSMWDQEDERDEFGRLPMASWTQAWEEAQAREERIRKGLEEPPPALTQEEIEAEIEERLGEPKSTVAPMDWTRTWTPPTADALPSWLIQAFRDAGLADSEPWTRWDARTTVGVKALRARVQPHQEATVRAHLARAIRESIEAGAVPSLPDFFAWLSERIAEVVGTKDKKNKRALAD